MLQILIWNSYCKFKIKICFGIHTVNSKSKFDLEFIPSFSNLKVCTGTNFCCKTCSGASFQSSGDNTIEKANESARKAISLARYGSVAVGALKTLRRRFKWLYELRDAW